MLHFLKRDSTTTQTATEARTLLYLLRGEEYPIDPPPIAELIDSTLFQNVVINFKGGSAANAIGQTKVGKPYPNPTNSSFSIDHNLAKDTNAQLTFYNHAGKLQAGYTLSGNGVFSVSTTDWASGMYYYHVTTDNEPPISGKIVVFK